MHPLLAVAALLALGACVPIPVLAPPAKFAVGPGYASGDVTDQNTGPDANSTGVLSFSAGVHPLQYFPEANGVDVGAGFILEAVLDDTLNADPLLGGYLELGYPLWLSGPVRPTKANPDPGAQGRLYLIGRGEALQNVGPGGESGFGGGVGLGIEWVGWVDNPVASINAAVDEQGDPDVSAFVGYAVGESGIGLEATANTRQVGPQQYNVFMLRLIFRTPATLGLLLVPISDEE